MKTKLIELNDIEVSETGLLKSDSPHFVEILDEEFLNMVYGGGTNMQCVNMYCPGSA